MKVFKIYGLDVRNLISDFKKPIDDRGKLQLFRTHLDDDELFISGALKKHELRKTEKKPVQDEVHDSFLNEMESSSDSLSKTSSESSETLGNVKPKKRPDKKKRLELSLKSGDSSSEKSEKSKPQISFSETLNSLTEASEYVKKQLKIKEVEFGAKNRNIADSDNPLFNKIATKREKDPESPAKEKPQERAQKEIEIFITEGDSPTKQQNPKKHKQAQNQNPLTNPRQRQKEGEEEEARERPSLGFNLIDIDDEEEEEKQERKAQEPKEKVLKKVVRKLTPPPVDKRISKVTDRSRLSTINFNESDFDEQNILDPLQHRNRTTTSNTPNQFSSSNNPANSQGKMITSSNTNPFQETKISQTAMYRKPAPSDDDIISEVSDLELSKINVLEETVKTPLFTSQAQNTPNPVLNQAEIPKILNETLNTNASIGKKKSLSPPASKKKIPLEKRKSDRNAGIQSNAIFMFFLIFY